MKVVVSGYFDPMHIGHLEYFKMAKLLAKDVELIVIVNNNKQSILKSGKFMMSDKDRVKLVGSLKYVDRVVLSIDTDRSVKETLRMINPDVFANGGDRHQGEIPEAEVCKELNIKMVDGLGNKIRLSSDMK